MVKRGAAAVVATLLLVSLGASLGQASPSEAAPSTVVPVAASGAADRGTEALIDVVRAYYAELGLDDGPVSALLTADLPVAVADGIADVLAGMLACKRITSGFEEEIYAVLAAPGEEPDLPWADDVKACGEDVTARLDALAAVLDASPNLGGGALDLWPVLYFDYTGGDTEHLYDYVLIVDNGGDDEYYNNAAGTPFDVLRNPFLTPTTPARGCQTDAELNTASGNCILIGAAAVLDRAGNDVYGRRETPQADAVCTSDLIVRRLATAGSGVAGVGILLDQAGNDAYLGKTLAIGMGHSGGFGLLRDAAGADSYSAIRSSVGAGVLVGLGVLEDRAGNDLYTWYDPAGGVIDNTGVCRAGTANLQGAAIIGAVGVLRDLAGVDTYNSAAATSQGMGSLAGVGVFVDWDGQDNYIAPLIGQRNNALIAGPTGTGGAGVFYDHP